MKPELIDFSNRLKNARLSKGLTQEELASLVGTTKSMISNYESATTDPRQSMVDKMATALEVSLNWLIRGTNENSTTLPSPVIYKTLRTMSRLNDRGQGKVSDYADDLDQSGQYARYKLMQEGAPPYHYEKILGAVAAGPGYCYGDENEEYRTFITYDPPKHDFSLVVKGDSMFPSLYDGDVIFLRQNPDKVDGHIYALDIDGATVVKRVYFEPDGLLLRSDNEAYEDRNLTPYELEHTRLLGEVVGSATPEEAKQGL